MSSNFHSEDFLAKCREQERYLDIIQNEHDHSIGSHEPEDELGFDIESELDRLHDEGSDETDQ